jgi:hypothetical protein
MLPSPLPLPLPLALKPASLPLKLPLALPSKLPLKLKLKALKLPLRTPPATGSLPYRTEGSPWLFRVQPAERKDPLLGYRFTFRNERFDCPDCYQN